MLAPIEITAKYTDRLPQIGDCLFMTDGGFETTLIFHDGVNLSLRGIRSAGRRRRPRRSAKLLRALHEDGLRASPRHRAREPDLARQSRLGSEARP